MFWFEWQLAIGVYDEAPTKKLLEEMANGIIEVIGVNFQVDRCVFVTFQDHVVNGGVPKMIGFVALAPHSSQKSATVMSAARKRGDEEKKK